MMVLPIRYPLIVALLACAVCEVIANDAAIDVGDRKQVFLDGTFVGSSRNIELTMNRPRRTGEVLIRPGHALGDGVGQSHGRRVFKHPQGRG